EVAGRVPRLGARVQTDSLGRPLREGERVAYTYFYPCGRFCACLANEPAACPAKIERPRGPSEFPHFHGAFAEYYYLRPRGALFLVPDALPDEMVAPVNCALSQVIFGLGRAGLAFGGSVVIQGAGGLGIQAAAVARDMGAATVIVVDQLPGRLELARAFGADHTINLKEVADRKERVALVRTWTGGGGADVVCDFVGFAQVIPEGIEMLRSGGTYLEIGTISRGAKVELEPSLFVWGSKKIVGVIQSDPWVTPRALARESIAAAKPPLESPGGGSEGTRPWGAPVKSPSPMVLCSGPRCGRVPATVADGHVRGGAYGSAPDQRQDLHGRRRSRD